MARVHVDAHRGQSLGRLAPGHARANASHALHHRGEVDHDAARGPASERLGVSYLAIEPCGANERLRRDAPRVQADSAQKVTLDERDAGALAERRVGRDETRRAGADDEQVVRLMASRHSQPPSKPARCSPVRTGGHSRINRNSSPDRWFSIISTTSP